MSPNGYGPISARAGRPAESQRIDGDLDVVAEGAKGRLGLGPRTVGPTEIGDAMAAAQLAQIAVDADVAAVAHGHGHAVADAQHVHGRTHMTFRTKVGMTSRSR